MRITTDRTIAAVLAITGPLTFVQILTHTGFSNDAVRKTIERLKDDGHITIRPGEPCGKQGRPPVCYALQETR